LKKTTGKNTSKNTEYKTKTTTTEEERRQQMISAVFDACQNDNINDLTKLLEKIILKDSIKTIHGV